MAAGRPRSKPLAPLPDGSAAAVLRTNLRAVIVEPDTVNAFAKRHDLDQSTINRYYNGDQGARIESLDAIATALGVQAWQLLAPRFGEGLHMVVQQAELRLRPVPLPTAQETREKPVSTRIGADVKRLERAANTGRDAQEATPSAHGGKPPRK